MENITNIVSTLGFPVCVSLALFYFATKFIESQIKGYNEREEKLINAYNLNLDRFTSQIDRFNEALCNFNATLNKIDSRLQVLEDAILGKEQN